MKAEFTTKDQNYQDETTIYWFEITESSSTWIGMGEIYGVADCNSELTILDCDGCPVGQEYQEILKNVLNITDEMIAA